MMLLYQIALKTEDLSEWITCIKQQIVRADHDGPLAPVAKRGLVSREGKINNAN